jgi:hypothetical protein
MREQPHVANRGLDGWHELPGVQAGAKGSLILGLCEERPTETRHVESPAPLVLVTVDDCRDLSTTHIASELNSFKQPVIEGDFFTSGNVTDGAVDPISINREVGTHVRRSL